MMKKYVFLALLAVFILGGQPQLAQDNTAYIAFVSNRELNDDIYVTNLQGTQVYNLTLSRARNWHPTWSPDGRRIAYNSDQDGNAEIYVMNNNGTAKRNLSNNAASDTSPDWSPAGDEIAFISDRDGGFDLYTLDVNSGDVQRLTTDGNVKSDPDWSPDGTHIVYWQQIDQTTIILNQIDVASGEVSPLNDSGQSQWPAWSPDGQQIAYFAAPSGVADIFLMDVATGTASNISNTEANDARPDWSPDGTRIVFMSNRDDNFNLYTMNADGGDVQPLTDAPQDDHSAVWQPVAVPIEYDVAALGLNVNIVQGAVSGDAQGELGAGQRRLFAPETVSIDDVIRVRFEIEVDGSEAAPEPTPDISLRDEAALTVYRFMGAELTGLDMDRFDIFPNPSGYVLQIREDGLNYWEWQLRPKKPDALGSNFLAVQLYLPEVQADGAIVRTQLETIPFNVEVVVEDPAVESDYVLEALTVGSGEISEGFSVYYSDQNVLSLAFAQETDVSDMTIATDGTEFPLLMDFPIFQQSGERVPANSCLYYENTGEEPVLPRACRTGQTYPYELVEGDIFWYDFNARQLRNVIIRKNDQVFICPAGINRCDF